LAFDADNHYYEALDAFTRHLDPGLGPRCVQWAEVNGRHYHVVGGRVSHAVVNPTFDPVAKAGALHDYFRGNPEGKSPLEFLRAREPIRADYRDRDARLATLDEFGLESIWLFPTLGILYEELLKHDPEAVTLTFTAFNRWLDEDWGVNYQDRIYAAPYLSLCDVDWAVRELDWALERDARVVVMRPAAPTTKVGQLPPTHPTFDPFWARANEAGITVEVLSNSGPGPDLVPGPDGVAMAREINDHLAKACAKYPARFAGFASLPMQSPDAAAKELARTVKELGFVGAMVNGTTEGKFLDDPSYDGILAAAEELDVPIYIHPHIPPAAVREAYFSGLPEGAGRVLETAGWGWHSEVAVHVLRMVVAGSLDKHPKLKLIIGHMGEMLPVMMARIEDVFANEVEHLKRPVHRTILDQVWLTTSGIFTEPPFLAALLTFGIDRIMFSIDYPYAPNADGRAFLDRLSLAPADMAKLTHRNADALLKLQV